MASAKRGDVDADFALIDRRFLVVVVELDRVFDGDDMSVDELVDVVDHGRERGRLSRPGRAGDDDQPAGPHDQFLVDLWARPGRPSTSSRGGFAAGPWRRCPAVGRRRRGIGPHHRRQSRSRYFPSPGIPVWQRSGVMLFISAMVSSGSSVLGFQPLQPTVNTEHGWLAGRDVKVARSLLDLCREQFVDKDRAHGSMVSSGDEI